MHSDRWYDVHQLWTLCIWHLDWVPELMIFRKSKFWKWYVLETNLPNLLPTSFLRLFRCFFSALHRLIVNYWFGARWFGILRSVSNNPFHRGIPGNQQWNQLNPKGSWIATTMALSAWWNYVASLKVQNGGPVNRVDLPLIPPADGNTNPANQLIWKICILSLTLKVLGGKNPGTSNIK